MWSRFRAWWLAWRFRRFLSRCRRWGMTAYPTDQANATARDLEELTAFTDHSGFLRDGRYPGGRQAERKIHQTVARVQGRLGMRKVP